MDLLDIPRCPWPRAARAAGLTDRAVGKDWINNKQFLLGAHDEWGIGKGIAPLLTLRTTYSLAITAALVKQGFHPARACLVSRLFTHTPVHYEDGTVREPGQL